MVGKALPVIFVRGDYPLPRTAVFLEHVER